MICLRNSDLWSRDREMLIDGRKMQKQKELGNRLESESGFPENPSVKTAAICVVPFLSFFLVQYEEFIRDEGWGRT